MLVKCRKCGNKIERNEAFKVVVGGKNAYYCNEDEYNEILKYRQLKDEVYLYVNNIFGYKVVNTGIFKEINEIVGIFGYDLLVCYLKDNESYLESTIQEKQFSSEYGKIRYFSAILKNSLTDYDKPVNQNKEDFKKCIEYDLPEVKFKRKKKRRNLSEIEAEVGE